MVAFGIIALGDGLLVFAAVASDATMRLAATCVGMFTIGVGAAFANPQMTGVALALTPSAQAGMVSAVAIIMRQAGFAISIAVLGASDHAAAFAGPFLLAAAISLCAVVAARILLPVKPPSN